MSCAGCLMSLNARILSAMTKRERSIVKGAIAGAIGGLAGAGAKMLAERIFPSRVKEQTPPPVALAEQVVGHSLPDGQKRAALHGIHWAFGAAAGAVYGAMVESEPSLGAWKGAAFGLTLNKITHESLLPKLGLVPPKEQQPAQERISEWVSHAVYGVFTDVVRRGVRRALD
jgi:putative membrane protein